MPRSENLVANAHLQRGLECAERSNPATGGNLANAREAITCFESAVKEDPHCADAFLEMARAWMQLSYSDPGSLANDEIFLPAKTAILEALSIRPDWVDALLVLAGLHYGLEFDWDAAERVYRRAIRLAPESAAARAGYAAYLSSMGRFGEATAEIVKAQKLSPSPANDVAAARIFYSMRDYQKAEACCLRSLENEDNVIARFYLGFIRAEMGDVPAAVAAFASAAAFSDNAGAHYGLAYGYARNAQTEEARQILARLKAAGGRNVKAAYRRAAVHLALGEADEALGLLEVAVETKDNWLTQLKVDPVMDPLRAAPEFRALLRALRLERSRPAQERVCKRAQVLKNQGG